jgi:hypothetical protein
MVARSVESGLSKPAPITDRIRVALGPMHAKHAPVPADQRIKRPHTAAEIRDEVARVLNAQRPFAFRVPLPAQAPRAPENVGCNWDMPADFRAHPGYQIEIGLALLSVQQRWDLQEDDPDVLPPGPWG